MHRSRSPSEDYYCLPTAASPAGVSHVPFRFTFAPRFGPRLCQGTCTFAAPPSPPVPSSRKTAEQDIIAYDRNTTTGIGLPSPLSGVPCVVYRRVMGAVATHVADVSFVVPCRRLSYSYRWPKRPTHGLGTVAEARMCSSLPPSVPMQVGEKAVSRGSCRPLSHTATHRTPPFSPHRGVTTPCGPLSSFKGGLCPGVTAAHQPTPTENPAGPTPLLRLRTREAVYSRIRCLALSQCTKGDDPGGPTPTRRVSKDPWETPQGSFHGELGPTRPPKGEPNQPPRSQTPDSPTQPNSSNRHPPAGTQHPAPIS